MACDVVKSVELYSSSHLFEVPWVVPVADFCVRFVSQLYEHRVSMFFVLSDYDVLYFFGELLRNQMWPWTEVGCIAQYWCQQGPSV